MRSWAAAGVVDWASARTARPGGGRAWWSWSVRSNAAAGAAGSVGGTGASCANGAAGVGVGSASAKCAGGAGPASVAPEPPVRLGRRRAWRRRRRLPLGRPNAAWQERRLNEWS